MRHGWLGMLAAIVLVFAIHDGEWIVVWITGGGLVCYFVTRIMFMLRDPFGCTRPGAD